MTRALIGELKAALKQGKHRAVLDQTRELLLGYPEQLALLTIAASATYALRLFEEAQGYLECAIRLKPKSTTLRESLERVRRKLQEN